MEGEWEEKATEIGGDTTGIDAGNAARVLSASRGQVNRKKLSGIAARQEISSADRR